MNKQTLINWLRTQQPTLESILLQSAKEYYEKYHTQNYFEFDVKETSNELYNLGLGQDLCYDRPTIGFSYAFWYHPKRINTFLRYFTDLIYDARFESQINIFDLGAGTGAVLWAVGLIVQGLKVLEFDCPKIRVISIDTSPFMLMYNCNYLWKQFVEKYPEATSVCLDKDYHLNSWSSLEEERLENIWLCASYLFDSSENEEIISEDFKEIIKKYQPSKVLLLTSSQPQKRVFCDKVADSILTLNYLNASSPSVDQVFSGYLNKLTAFRNKISEDHKLGLRGNIEWRIDTLYGRVVSSNKIQRSLNFDALNLYIQPQKDRAKIKMTEQQFEAAKAANKPTLIIGPAGCGKSVVLIQRVKNILEDSKINGLYDINKKILITTFNKALVKYLGDWIEQLLDEELFTRHFDEFKGKKSDYSHFRFEGSPFYNIYVMHFDVLPTQIGRITGVQVNPNYGSVEKFHLLRMQMAIDSFVTSKDINVEKFKKILNAEFLIDEYHRIVYGTLCSSYNNKKTPKSNYCDVERLGRGNNPQIRTNSERRKMIWDIINLYLQNLKNDGLESFIIRRHKFIKKLQRNGFNNKFTDILVDEFQDCTKADYEIFYHLLEDSNKLVLAGDIAQAIHIGSTLHIPKNDDQSNFKTIKLEGSFRLPFRVSECIKPLSESINQGFLKKQRIKFDSINPYKGAPPGARPIFVFADDIATAANKVETIFKAYRRALKLDKVSIFEKDTQLLNLLLLKSVSAEAEIILKTKGLEKSCVLWSTRMSIDTQTEKEEFIYTILTRTVSLLIILVFPEIEHDYKEIIKKLKFDRLIFWDEESKLKYTELIKGLLVKEEEEDEDNSMISEFIDEGNLDEIIE